MGASEPITLSRACEVIEIPSGIRATLPAGAVVRIMQSLGSGYTVATDRGKHLQSGKGLSAIRWSGISSRPCTIPRFRSTLLIWVWFTPP
jgi:hypothetical protein